MDAGIDTLACLRHEGFAPNSKSVGSPIGRSPAFAPIRIWSIKDAVRWHRRREGGPKYACKILPRRVLIPALLGPSYLGRRKHPAATAIFARSFDEVVAKAIQKKAGPLCSSHLHKGPA
jgi:hypothetical protein